MYTTRRNKNSDYWEIYEGPYVSTLKFGSKKAAIDWINKRPPQDDSLLNQDEVKAQIEKCLRPPAEYSNSNFSKA